MIETTLCLGKCQIIELLGKCVVGNTGGYDSFKLFDVSLKNNAGTIGICFIFRTEADEALRFEDFCFAQGE